MYYLLNGKISLIDTLGIVAQNYDGDLKSRIIRTKQQIEKGVSLHRAFLRLLQIGNLWKWLKLGKRQETWK